MTTLKTDPTNSGAHQLIDTLSQEITEDVLTRIRAELDSTQPEGGLMKVSRAAEWLEVHPDHVYKLIASGELVGYPFPDEKSHMHVEVDSLKELLRRRRQNFERNTGKFS